MAYTKYSDIFDPEVIKKLEKASMPNLWRYDGLAMPDVIEAIEEKQVPAENANMAQSVALAASQYVDDAVISALEGSAAALSANQNDASGSGDITLAAITDTKAKAKDKIRNLDSGAIIMHSKVYYDALGLGLVAATANTMGIQLQEGMVKDGVLPATILGLTPIVTDKLSLDGSDYRTFLVGSNALVLRGNEAPMIEVSRPDDAFTTFTKFMVGFGVGVPGMKWGASGSEKVSDTDLSTSTNWSLATNANSNDVAIYRLQTT